MGNSTRKHDHTRPRGEVNHPVRMKLPTAPADWPSVPGRACSRRVSRLTTRGSDSEDLGFLRRELLLGQDPLLLELRELLEFGGVIRLGRHRRGLLALGRVGLLVMAVIGRVAVTGLRLRTLLQLRRALSRNDMLSSSPLGGPLGLGFRDRPARCLRSARCARRKMRMPHDRGRTLTDTVGSGNSPG
jgi:hypothetical protein